MKNNGMLKRSCNYKKTLNTLDYCHKYNIELFEQQRKTRDEKRSLVRQKKERLNEINEKHNNEKTDDEFKHVVELKECIKNIEKELEIIDSNKDMLDYYTNTSDILYNYYDLVENNSDNNMNIKHQIDQKTTKNKSILEYFHTENTSEANMQDDDGSDDTSTELNRASLLDDYLSITDKNYINDNIDNSITLKCEHCQSTDKTILYNDSISVCNKCFSIQHLLTDNEKPSYKDPPKEISYFSYKRINHYQEWLNQIQGKETTDIPEEVFDKIMLELKKQRITETKLINRSKIKEILKKLKINKYYEHIPYILNRITGIPNPNLTQELEEKLRNMFKEIQVPFLKHSPLIRKNFLSYSYVIHKFIQLLEKNEYLKYFPLLKSREKLHQQEEIWKKICNDLGWKFIRSI